LLDLDGTLGLSGWQWVFIATGFPAIVLTPIVLAFLPNEPAKATFLSDAEKTWLAAEMSTEAPASHSGNPFTAIWDRRVLLLSVTYMLILASLYGVIYWLPTVVKAFGATGTENGMLSSIPWMIAAVFLFILPRRLRQERVVLTAMVAISIVGLVCFYLSTTVPANWMRLVALSIGTPCISLLFPCLWFLPSLFFTGTRAATAIATISTIGNLGGFFAQNAMPWVAQAAGAPVAAMLVPSVCLTAVGILAIYMRMRGFGEEPKNSVSAG
jgi:nitrate/nitrite transporter NarK